jgi:hypothetical protein
MSSANQGRSLPAEEEEVSVVIIPHPLAVGKQNLTSLM